MFFVFTKQRICWQCECGRKHQKNDKEKKGDEEEQVKGIRICWFLLTSLRMQILGKKGSYVLYSMVSKGVVTTRKYLVSRRSLG